MNIHAFTVSQEELQKLVKRCESFVPVSIYVTGPAKTGHMIFVYFFNLSEIITFYP